MKKKGIGGLKLIVTAIVLITMLFIIMNIFLDKNFIDDTLDFLDNIWEVDVDSDTQRMNRIIIRQEAISYTAEWIDTFNAMMNTNEEYCYSRMPSTNRDFREESFTLAFTSTEKDSFNIELKQNSLMATVPETINAPLCIIAEPQRSKRETEIIKNFQEAFYDQNQNAKTNCLNNPSQCAWIFSQPQTALKEINEEPESFFVKFELNSESVREKRESFSLEYTITPRGQEPTQIINSDVKLSDSDYLLFKMKDSICIMPLSRSQGSCTYFPIIGGGHANRIGNLNILRRGCFLESSRNDFVPNQKLLEIPPCGATQEEITELLRNDIMITFALIRSGPTPNTFYPKLIKYDENEGWLVISALDDTNIRLPSSSHRSPTIINNVKEILKDKNLEEGRRTLCETYTEQEDVTMQGETATGNPFQTTYTITRIEGLRCDLLENINN